MAGNHRHASIVSISFGTVDPGKKKWWSRALVADKRVHCISHNSDTMLAIAPPFSIDFGKMLKKIYQGLKLSGMTLWRSAAKSAKSQMISWPVGWVLLIANILQLLRMATQLRQRHAP